MENKLKQYLIEIRKIFEDDTTRKSIMDGNIEDLSDSKAVFQYFGGWLIHRTEDAPMRPVMQSIDALKQAGLDDCYNTVANLKSPVSLATSHVSAVQPEKLVKTSSENATIIQRSIREGAQDRNQAIGSMSESEELDELLPRFSSAKRKAGDHALVGEPPKRPSLMSSKEKKMVDNCVEVFTAFSRSH